jgi:hypothetical protein
MKSILFKILFSASLLLVEVGCVTDSTILFSSTTTPINIATSQQTLDSIAEERQSGMEIGITIISAIEQYYKSTGYYPGELGDLVPDFLGEIPTTTTGQDFRYVLYQPDFIDWPYVLYFYGVNGEWGCAYHAKDGDWECGRKGVP